MTGSFRAFRLAYGKEILVYFALSQNKRAPLLSPLLLFNTDGRRGGVGGNFMI
jgi:hypothetical protein